MKPLSTGSAERPNSTRDALVIASHFPADRLGPYDGADVFGLAGRRIAEGIVALFALLGFAFVPLGTKTALEHTRDILTTPTALGAFREIVTALDRLRTKIVSTALPPSRLPPSAPEETAPPKDRTGPRPDLPELAPAPGARP